MDTDGDPTEGVEVPDSAGVAEPAAPPAAEAKAEPASAVKEEEKDQEVQKLLQNLDDEAARLSDAALAELRKQSADANAKQSG